MITRVVCLHIEPEFVDDFIHHFDDVSQLIRSFPGCCSLELLRDSVEPGILFTLSTWENADYFESYRSSELFLGTWSKVKPLFCAKPRAWSLSVIRTLNN